MVRSGKILVCSRSHGVLCELISYIGRLIVKYTKEGQLLTTLQTNVRYVANPDGTFGVEINMLEEMCVFPFQKFINCT